MTTARKTAKKAAKKTTAKKAAKTTTAKKAAKTTTAKKAAKTTTAKKTATKKIAASKVTPAKKATKKIAASKAPPAKKSSKKAAQHAARKVTVEAPAKKSSKKAAQHAARKVAAEAPPAKPAKVAEVAAPPEPLMGPNYAVLKADYKRQPGDDDINRVGGRPIGFDAASWPRREGVPMYHVLTIDLKDHPVIVPQRFRALALFISSPMKHEAYQSGNDHTRVILLTEDDLRKGVPAWPDGLDKDEALRAGRLRFESAAELTEKKLYQHSFAGDEPIWLQGDESDEDYDDYGDDDDSGDDDDDSDDDSSDDAADTGPSVPHIFVLQFDERLIPGINLGDAGIMYVYADSAWFQCH